MTDVTFTNVSRWDQFLRISQGGSESLEFVYRKHLTDLSKWHLTDKVKSYPKIKAKSYLTGKSKSHLTVKETLHLV